MASFSKMGAFPAGYFRGIAMWLLQNRRDLPARISVLQAEIGRIGIIEVTYATYQDSEGNTRATEKATGIAVSEGSTLAHLVRAYLATGGNLFNISKFLMPNSTTEATAAGGSVLVEKYPGGGVVAAKSAEYNDPLPMVQDRETLDGTSESQKNGDPEKFTAPQKSGYEGHPGGYLNTDRYFPGRMGARMDRGGWDSDTVVRTMHDIRAWANQDIKTRLRDMEWRIIKQMDLREQLCAERDSIIVQAFGGLQPGLPPFDEFSIRPERMVPLLIDEMAKLIATKDPETARLIGSGAGPMSGFLTFVFPSAASESLETL